MCKAELYYQTIFIKTFLDRPLIFCVRFLFQEHRVVEIINNSSIDIVEGSRENGNVGYYALRVKEVGTTDIVNKSGYLLHRGYNYLIGYIGCDTELVLPNDYNGHSYKIYEYAFYCCSGLTSVMIPDNVTSIGERLFYGCSGLTSITIPDSVTSIGDEVFSYCGLTSITIPDSVTNIGYRAFNWCSQLTCIEFKGTKEQWDNIVKNMSWDYETGNYTIHCTDGDIEKS